MISKTIIAAVSLTFASGIASGEILALEGDGTIEMYSGSFNGADLFPFAGLNDYDAISFRYQFDTNTLPSSIDGMVATYQIDPTGSYMQLGDSVLNFDSVILRIGTYTSGTGFLRFTGYNSVLGVTAGMVLAGSDSLSMDLPLSIEYSSFTSGREFYADTDANKFLLPVAFGLLDGAQITPSPGTIPLIMGSLLIFTRRRRD